MTRSRRVRGWRRRQEGDEAICGPDTSASREAGGESKGEEEALMKMLCFGKAPDGFVNLVVDFVRFIRSCISLSVGI